jgi:hypothetical protein
MVLEFFQLSLSNKRDQTKSTHNVDDWEEALDQVSKESQFEGSLESELNFDENEMYDSIARDNQLKLIVQRRVGTCCRI